MGVQQTCPEEWPLLSQSTYLEPLCCRAVFLDTSDNKNQIEKYHDVCFGEQETDSFLYQCPDKYAQFQCGDEVDGKLTKMIGQTLSKESQTPVG